MLKISIFPLTSLELLTNHLSQQTQPNYPHLPFGMEFDPKLMADKAEQQ
jgi:hypothetical protein